MIKTWAVTDTGLVRKENQDTYRIARNGDICVVCDGMGGAAGGRLASTLASETYAAEMEKALKPDMTPEQLREASAYAVAMANRAVAERAEAEAALANMGTTLVAAVAYENGAVIANVGDSRAYHITREGIRQVSRDHSVVEDMVEKGDLTRDEARHHPRRNLITRALGTEPGVAADAFPLKWQQGDFLLLCSDGLINTVSDQELLFEVIHSEPLDTCLDRLLALSRQRGAPDNVTAVLLMNI